MQSIATIYLSSFVFVQLNVILRMFLSVIKSGYDTVVEEKEAAEEAKAEAKAAKKVRDAAEAAEEEEERQRSMDNASSDSVNSVASSFGSSGSSGSSSSSGSRGREANREADRFGDAAIRQISGRSLQWWNEEQRSPGMSVIPIG
jgi:hypothetical protein